MFKPLVLAGTERYLSQVGIEETRMIRRREVPEVSNDAMRRQRLPPNPLYVSVELDERAEADEGEQAWRDLPSGSIEVQ